jgi:hypothetical protein
MVKSPNDKNKIDDKKRDELALKVLRMPANPHKQHADKSPAKRKKKGDGPTVKKSRRPQRNLII